MNQTKLNQRPIVITDEIVNRYAEAWRNSQQAEKELEAVKADMREILSVNPIEYTYSDGAIVDFKAVEGARVNPVGYVEAKELTGFGEANMQRIAGAIDAKKVIAMVQLGKLDASLLEKLLPKAPYTQIRGTFRK